MVSTTLDKGYFPTLTESGEQLMIEAVLTMKHGDEDSLQERENISPNERGKQQGLTAGSSATRDDREIGSG
jgi:hypothetical protein